MFLLSCKKTDQNKSLTLSLIVKTTNFFIFPQVQVGTGQILGLALLEEERVLVSLEEKRLVLLDSTGKVAMP